MLPFLVADPGALWRDTVSYGAGTYRIVGYGLAALLLNLGAIDDRFGDYPFVWLALVLWLPLTAWLLWAQRRAGTLWAGAIGFSVSMFVLLFLSRVFQSSYLAWPLTGIGLALLARFSRAHFSFAFSRWSCSQRSCGMSAYTLFRPGDVDPCSRPRRAPSTCRRGKCQTGSPLRAFSAHVPRGPFFTRRSPPAPQRPHVEK